MKEETQQYATKSQIAAAAARTAANYIEREMWVEAYIELLAAARICRTQDNGTENERDERPTTPPNEL